MMDSAVAVVDAEELPLEITMALEAAEKRNERAVRSGGMGDSDVALQITKDRIGAVSETIHDWIVEEENNSTKVADILRLVGKLSPELLALCGLNSVLTGVAGENTITEIYRQAGEAVRGEVWAHDLHEKYPQLAISVEKQAYKGSGRVERRRTIWRSKMTKAINAENAKRRTKHKFKFEQWSGDQLARVGNWLVSAVLAGTPGLFTISRGNVDEPYRLYLCEDALEKAEGIVGELVLRYTPYLPKTVEPAPWTQYQQVIDAEHHYAVSFIRTHHKETAAACKHAIRDGSMKPALDAVSRLQSVPWRINKRIYGVICGCMERGIQVEGLPNKPAIPLPHSDTKLADMSELERNLFLMEYAECKQANAELLSERLLYAQDMKVAERLVDAERFFTAMNCDWRGRVYALPHFNFQREDRVRAMFEFADGMPIGDAGLRWLQMHVANCGDFDKISKQPIEDRIAWTVTNTSRITEMCETPLTDLWWTQADKPFLFLAACLELVAALHHGTAYVTRLPVSFDGSCSGLQHLSAMTRDAETASLVNLTVGEKPSDVYAVVAEVVKQRVADDTDPLAAKFLAYGIDRKLAKRNVMTYSYSSKKYGMAAQQQVDLMDNLQKKVLRKEIAEHPFAPSHKGGSDKPGKAARFIAGHVFDAIERTIHRPAQAMKFLQAIAKAMAHEGKPVTWRTPSGLPWVNRYHEPITTTLRLFMHDRGVKMPMRIRVAVGSQKGIDKDKAANGVAPNFVHALDAAHLQLTVNAAVDAGIRSIATVHDSFGCLAPQAAEFNKIIRAEFVRMYETHDVLFEVLKQASCDLTPDNRYRLPEVLEYGNLNLKEIENATYAFA